MHVLLHESRQHWQFCHSCLKAQIFSLERQGQIGLKGNSLCRGLMERGCDHWTIKRHFTLKFHWIFSGVCSCVKCHYRNTGSIPRHLHSPYSASQSIPSPAGTCRQPGPFPISQPPHCRALEATHWSLFGHSGTLMALSSERERKKEKKKEQDPSPSLGNGIIFHCGEDQASSLPVCNNSPHCLGKPLWCPIALDLLVYWLFWLFLFPYLSRLICLYFNWSLTFLVLATRKLFSWKVSSTWNILLYSMTVFVQVLFTTKFFCAQSLSSCLSAHPLPSVQSRQHLQDKF